ncbi:hypothetical protein [Methylosinus sp. KRF6]|uniref:hypothetical protein n=1 Tax=Methylosinus sp. KRF6 TaxID=2846853 RepID=UPI001C0DF538|nr:hypothetical protein [Methylosinus sp. KRF6]MBU3888589.1 hypothetical protein [Methylosinus sp. KRF6]
MARKTGTRADFDRPALKRTKLSYDQRAEIDRRIATKIEKLGENPHRPMSPDWDFENGDYPHPRNRWIFPSVAFSRAGDHARDFARAMQGVNTSQFRLITLRNQNELPKQGELATHLNDISAAFNGVVRYLIRKGIARPQLSATHTRYSAAAGRLDPHIHGIWEIPSEMIERARSLLQKTFGGGVWIDEKPVEDVRKAAFYICSGIIDHAAAPSWPPTVLGEVWRLSPHLHYVRPAGRYAEWIKQHNRSADGASANKPDRRGNPLYSASPPAQENHSDSDTPGTNPTADGTVPSPSALVLHLLLEIAKNR